MKKISFSSNEDRILSKLNHKNIIKLYKVEKRHNLFKVMHLQKLNNKSLEQMNLEKLHQNDNCENDIKIIIFQILDALRHVHSNNLIHNDLTPENILYDNITKKITIMNFSKSVKENSIIKSLGSRYYTAPDKVIAFFEKKPITRSIDIYSLGCIFHVLLTGYTVHNFVKPNDIYLKKDKKNGIFLEKLEGYSNDCKNLLYKMLYRDPKLRISIDEAINHNWFKNKL